MLVGGLRLILDTSCPRVKVYLLKTPITLPAPSGYGLVVSSWHLTANSFCVHTCMAQVVGI